MVQLFFSNPAWAVKLLRVRFGYFLSRKVPTSLETPDGYRIQTASELISYWTFFVEREGWWPEWGNELKKQSSPVVLDVGANAGVFSHWIWTQNPAVELVAFEPLPKMASRIHEWQTRTGARLTLHNAAVSDHAGTAIFYAAAENDTSASLRPDSPKAIKLQVPLITLDSVVPEKPILLAKIDVEGCEAEALAGASQTIKNTRFILIEAHTVEAFEKIRVKLPRKDWDYKKVGTSDYFFLRR